MTPPAFDSRSAQPFPVELEVIACSVEDAQAAEQGGASRIELTVQLDQDGLTPPLDLVRDVLARVTIPVRAMLRDRPDFAVGSLEDLARLRRQASEFAGLGVEGIVTGFVSDESLDLEALEAILAEAPATRFTVHRALERTRNPAAALRALRRFPNVDRALVSGGAGSLADWIDRWAQYQEALGPARRLIAGGGLMLDLLPAASAQSSVTVFHLGRAVRTPEEAGGRVDEVKVRRACELLGIAKRDEE
jgi:copper homeostasis protein